MLNEVTFDVPRGMEPEIVAETLSAYLLGSLALHNEPNRDGSRTHGPNFDHDKWQLDSSNDYWLTIDGSTASFRCRYPAQEAVLKAAAALFELRYVRRPI